MKVFVVLTIFFVAVASQLQDYAGPPIPYAFNYAAPTEDGGSSSREESGDGSGRVSGTYSVNNLEGHNRVVEYTADETGFRATIRTNEPGTANQNPADVVMESSAEGAIGGGLGPVPAPMRPMMRQPAPVRPGGAGRYVLVPMNDERARGYY